MEGEAELRAEGWTGHERVAFAKLFGSDPIDVIWADVRAEMRERLTQQLGKKGKTKSTKVKSAGRDDWMERRMAVESARPKPPEPEPDGLEPEPEGVADGLELLPATITFADRNFEIMSCRQAQSISTGEMRCFLCKGNVESETQHSTRLSWCRCIVVAKASLGDCRGWDRSPYMCGLCQ